MGEMYIDYIIYWVLMNSAAEPLDLKWPQRSSNLLLLPVAEEIDGQRDFEV